MDRDGATPPADADESEGPSLLHKLAPGYLFGPESIELISYCTTAETITPDRLPEVIEAITLFRHLLTCTTAAAVDGGHAYALRRTKAHWLLVGLVEELQTLAAGAPSPGLQPLQPDGAGTTVKQSHPAHQRLKNECVAAVEVLHLLVGMTKLKGRALVSEAVRKNFVVGQHYSFGESAIESHATTMRANSALASAVHEFLYDAFPYVYAYPPDAPLERRVQSSMSPSEIEANVLWRVTQTAVRAERIVKLAQDARRD